MQKENDLDLVHAIGGLSENYQTVIILFYYHDLPIRTISGMMEKPENTVKTYLRRAKAELKAALEGGKDHEQKLV